MPSRQDCQQAVVGGQINDGTLAHYQAYGATSNDFNTAEYEFLVANGATPGHNHDMWRELLVPLLGYSAALPDMLQDFWCNFGGVFTPPAPPLFDGSIPNLNSLNFVNNASVYDASQNFDTGGFVNQYTLINAPAFMSITNRGVIRVTLDETADPAAVYSNIQVQGNNITGPAATSNTFSLTIDTNAPIFSGGPIPNIIVGEGQPITPPISTAVYFTTGGPVVTYALVNAPAWLNIDPNTGVLTGTPTTGDDATNVQVTGTNADGTAPSNTFDITVVDVVTPPVFDTLNPIPDITGNVGVAITPYDVAAGGHFTGDPVTVWQLFGAPSWMSINPSTGLITGTPDASGTTNNIRVRANNNGGSADSNFFASIVSADVIPLFAWNPSETAQLLPEQTGTTRASGAAVTDHEGIIRQALDGEQRFENARRVENLFNDSENLESANWIKTNCTVVGNRVTSTAQFSSVAGSANGIVDAIVGETYIYSIDLTSISGGTEFRIQKQGSAIIAESTNVNITIDGTRRRYSRTVTVTSAGTLSFRTQVNVASDFPVYDQYGSQLEESTGRADVTTPSEYVSVGVDNGFYGADKITNGTFDTDTDWIKGTGWTINGLANCDGTQTGNSNLQQTGGGFDENGIAHQIEFDILNYSAGQVRVSLGGSALTKWFTGNGSVSVSLSTDGGNNAIYIQADVDFVGSIDNVVVREIKGPSNIDGVQAFATTNGNTVADGTQGQPELVTNGDFTSDITSWTDLNSTSSWHSGGHINVVYAAAASGAYQSFTTEVGKTYRVRASIVGSSGYSANTLIRVGNGTTPDAGIADSDAFTAPGMKEVQFTATGTSSYVYLRSSASHTTLWDNVTCKEYTAGSDTGIVTPGVGTPLPNIAALQEPASDNLAQHSQALGNPYWSPSNITVTSDAVISPNGTVTAELLEDDNSTSSHRLGISAEAQPAGTYTSSVYVKDKNKRYAWIQAVGRISTTVQRHTAVFDLQTGELTDTESVNSPTGIKESIEDAGNGWYKISATIDHDGTSTIFIVFGLSDSGTPTYGATNGYPEYQGVVGEGAYFWQAQWELSSVPTSPIKTEGTTVSRATDTAITSALTTPQAEGMVIAEINGLRNTNPAFGIVNFSTSISNGPCLKQASLARNRAADGTNFAFVNLSADYEKIATRWGSLTMTPGEKTSAAWTFAADASYNGNWESNGNLYIGYSPTVNSILHIKEVEVFDQDLGQAWIEANR